MSALAELVQRTQRLQNQATSLVNELAQLQKDLEALSADRPESGMNGPSKSWTEVAAEPQKPGPDCLAVALALAQDLGPEFSRNGGVW